MTWIDVVNRDIAISARSLDFTTGWYKDIIFLSKIWSITNWHVLKINKGIKNESKLVCTSC